MTSPIISPWTQPFKYEWNHVKAVPFAFNMLENTTIISSYFDSISFMVSRQTDLVQFNRFSEVKQQMVPLHLSFQSKCIIATIRHAIWE